MPYYPPVAASGHIFPYLVLTDAVSRIVPGGTSFSLRNAADSLDHVRVTDKGNVVIYPETQTLAGTFIGIQLGTTSNTYTNPSGATAALVRVDGNFQSADGTGSIRVLAEEAHWTDAAHGISTFAGAYINVYHDTAQDIQDLIGVIGRVFVTAAGALSSVGTWGLRGDINFITATTLATVMSSTAAIVAHQGQWSTPATIPQYSGLEVKSHTLNAGGVAVTNGYGAKIAFPSQASGHNVALFVGDDGDIVSGAITKLGMYVANGGAWVRGQMAIPYADTSNINATLALYAGTHAGANDNLALLYFYRGSASLGFIGYDSDVASVMAGHTKTLTDFVLKGAKVVIDSNGQLWSNQMASFNKVQIIPTVQTSSTLASPMIYTGAAHTGLTPSSFAEFNWNANRTISFDASGTTIATAYTFQFQKPVYSAAAAMIMSNVATVRITGAPTTSAAAGFAPTLTASWALYVDSGATNLQALTMTGILTMLTSASQVVPGATSWALRNNANSLNNILVLDSGVVSLVNALNIAGPNASTTIVDITDSGARDVITMRTQIPSTPPAASNIIFAVGQFPSTLTNIVDTYVAHFRGIGQGSAANAGQSVLRVHFVKATDYATPWNTNYNGTQLTAAGNFQNDSTGGGANPMTGAGLATPAPFASNAAVIGVVNSVTSVGWNVGGLFVSNKSTVINIGIMGVAVANAGGELNNIGVLGVARDTGASGISNSGYFYVSAAEPPVPTASSCVTFDVAATAIDMVHGLFNTGNVWTVASRGTWAITPTATAGGLNVFVITPPNAGTIVGEIFSFNIVANTLTVTAGYTTQRFNVFGQPTLTAATSQTVVNAATVAIVGAPIPAGVGPLAITVTPWSLWVQSGSSSFAGSIVMGHSVQTINATATASAAQVAAGYIKCTSTTAVTITLPTGTLLGAILGASQGTVHFLTIDNTASSSSGVVTIAVAVNGILSADAAANPASAGLLTIPVGVTGQGTFMLMFSSATAYTFTRIA